MDLGQALFAALMLGCGALFGLGLGLSIGVDRGRKLVRDAYETAWLDGWKMAELVTKCGLPNSITLRDMLLAGIMGRRGT